MSSFSSRRLNGKVAIVTGSSSGIGESTALVLAEKGACVTLCGRDKGRLEEVRAKCCQLTGHPERFIVVSGDLTTPATRTRTVEETVKTFGKLDILVANAGEANMPGPYMDLKEEQYDQMVNILLKATLFLIQECVPHLEKTKGVIAAVSSVASLHCAPYMWAYSCIKAALNHLVRTLAILLGPRGIRVNATCPGFAITKIFRVFGDQTESVSNEIALSTGQFSPLEDRVSTVSEQSDVIAFLVSDESSYVHGELIPVDGLISKVSPGFNENYYVLSDKEQ